MTWSVRAKGYRSRWPAWRSGSVKAAIATKLQAENAQIADWLVRLTENNRNWGFGLSFLYLRNVKGYGWNHKRVYRIYRNLELNLRIRPEEASRARFNAACGGAIGSVRQAVRHWPGRPREPEFDAMRWYPAPILSTARSAGRGQVPCASAST